MPLLCSYKDIVHDRSKCPRTELKESYRADGADRGPACRSEAVPRPVRLAGNPAHWTECALLEQGIPPLSLPSSPHPLPSPSLCINQPQSHSSAQAGCSHLGLQRACGSSSDSQLRASASWNSFLFGCNQWILKQLWKFVQTEGLFNNPVPSTAPSYSSKGLDL